MHQTNNARCVDLLWRHILSIMLLGMALSVSYSRWATLLMSPSYCQDKSSNLGVKLKVIIICIKLFCEVFVFTVNFKKELCGWKLKSTSWMYLQLNLTLELFLSIKMAGVTRLLFLLRTVNLSLYHLYIRSDFRMSHSLHHRRAAALFLFEKNSNSPHLLLFLSTRVCGTWIFCHLPMANSTLQIFVCSFKGHDITFHCICPAWVNMCCVDTLNLRLITFKLEKCYKLFQAFETYGTSSRVPPQSRLRLKG